MSNITDDASLTYAPSCTVEDAALYLMGVPQSHLQPQLWKSSDDPLGGEWFSLESYQHLAEEWDAAKFSLKECQNAKNKNTQKLVGLEDEKNKNSKNVDKTNNSRLTELINLAVQTNKNLDQAIIKKQAELVEASNKYKKAHSYKTAIINELAKGAASSLHIDSVATPNARNPYITLLSLKEWAHKSLNISILNELDTVKPIKTVSMARQQENAILDEIKKLGYDPQNLPKIIPGKRGVKAAVRKLVQHPPLFISVKVFDTAWDRLLKYKDVINLE